jgi:hydroxyethylthiazole kinase-like uncharacterized protein yjeF
MSTYLYRVDELRAIEQRAQATLAPGTLMARAGRSAAARIAALTPERPATCCVVCGPGNNGGDGFVVAAELRENEHEVVCVLPGPAPTTDDARAALARWNAAGGAVAPKLPVDSRFDVVVDAMFGIGLARPLAGRFLDSVNWMRQQQQVVAIDVPSGLDADTGAWVGGVAGAAATMTVTFIGDKPGLHTADGVDAAGEVVVEDIGIEPVPSQGTLVMPADLHPVLRPRRRNTHKGTYGNVAVVGGGRGMVGAALLGARAALHLGTGRVYVDLLGAPEFRVDPMQPELMFRSVAELSDLQAIVVGCGLGMNADARVRLAEVLARDTPLVVDADALNLIAGDPALQQQLATRTAPAILTPHPLEAARLLGIGASEVQSDRIRAASEVARRYRAIALLKGAGTVIAEATGSYAINPTGSPALATAGTGDVLAGMIGALLAQGIDGWDATLAAAWLHGRAAENRGDIGLVASDVAPLAAALLRHLRGFSG